MNELLTMLDSIPEDTIAVVVYLVGSVIILASWYSIAQRLPRPLGGMTWIILFALILTPTVSEGNNASLAPAVFGLLFGFLTHNQALMWTNLSLILFVIGVGFIVGFFWSRYLSKKAKYTANNKSSPL